jgi:hypothetical protein
MSSKRAFQMASKEFFQLLFQFLPTILAILYFVSHSSAAAGSTRVAAEVSRVVARSPIPTNFPIPFSVIIFFI